jgi:serine/threonine-protein kinase
VEELSSALELFNKAINFDPKFAKAYQGIADTYVEQIFWGRSATSAVLGLAKEAANKALALDPASGEIYGVLGSIKFFEFEKSESREYLLKSIELSPSYLAGHERLALLYMSEMETEKAIACFRKAWELDPFSTKFIGQIGQAYYVAKRYEEGLTFLEKEQEKHPNDAWIQWMRSYVHTGMGEYQKAVDILTTRGTSGKNTNWLLGYNYGKLGKVKEAEAILSIHLQRRALDYVPAFMISAIYIGMDRMDEALEWVQRDLEDGAPGHVFMGHVDDPMYAQLRSDPRYLALDLPKFR